MMALIEMINQEDNLITLDNLLVLKDRQKKPVIVCLCGSTRFSQAYQEMNLRETLAGNIVLSIGINTKSDDDLIKAGWKIDKEALDTLHLHKIDLADEVLILNVGGYTGESTRREIEYALLKNKHIRWLEPDKLCCCCQRSVTDDQAIIITGVAIGDTYRFCPTCKSAVHDPNHLRLSAK